MDIEYGIWPWQSIYDGCLKRYLTEIKRQCFQIGSCLILLYCYQYYGRHGRNASSEIIVRSIPCHCTEYVPFVTNDGRNDTYKMFFLYFFSNLLRYNWTSGSFAEKTASVRILHVKYSLISDKTRKVLLLLSRQSHQMLMKTRVQNINK